MIAIKDWNIEKMTGYKPITTLYQDFSIADHFGEQSIKDTYEDVFSWMKDDVKYVTELVMVLNWKIWEHYETNKKYGELYDKLWRECQDWCYDNLKGSDLTYFFRTTD